MSYRVVCGDYEVPPSFHDVRPYREFRPYPPRIELTCDSCKATQDFGHTVQMTMDGETCRIEGWLLVRQQAFCPACHPQEPPKMHWIDLPAKGATWSLYSGGVKVGESTDGGRTFRNTSGETPCPDCHGTGIYRGLVSEEPCWACGGNRS